MNSTSRIARVTKFRAAQRDAAMPPAKSIWLRITPPKIVPRALVSRGSMVTLSVGSRASAMGNHYGKWQGAKNKCVSRRLNVGEPLGVLLRRFSLDDIEESSLQIFGYRTAFTGADLPVVDFAHRR